MTFVLPLPVTPSRTCWVSPDWTPLTSCSMASGWSPAGLKGASTRKREVTGHLIRRRTDVRKLVAPPAARDLPTWWGGQAESCGRIHRRLARSANRPHAPSSDAGNTRGPDWEDRSSHHESSARRDEPRSRLPADRIRAIYSHDREP